MMKKLGIGIDLGGTAIKYGVCTLEGEILWHASKPTEGLTSAATVLDNICNAIKEAAAFIETNGDEVLAVGVGTPGLVKEDNIIVGCANNISGWDNIHLADKITEKVNFPCFVANDADMMGYGEFVATGAKKLDTVLFATLGTGIGGALFVKGELFQGHYGLGGELGVFPMMVNGEMLNWEDIASTAAMVRNYKRISGLNDATIDGKHIIAKYKAGDSFAITAIDMMTTYVGMGLGGFINVFNPKKIVIGGGIVEAGDFFMEKIVKSAHIYAIKECIENVEISAATLGNKAGLLGAALFGLEKMNKNLTTA